MKKNDISTSDVTEMERGGNMRRGGGKENNDGLARKGGCLDDDTGRWLVVDEKNECADCRSWCLKMMCLDACRATLVACT